MLRTRKYLAAGLALLFMVGIVGPVLASDLSEQKEQVEQQMQAQQGRKAAAQQKVDSVADQLKKVESELSSAQNDYKTIQTKLETTEKQIETNAVILATAEKKLAARGLILNKRIRDIYQNGQLSYLDVLLGANDFSDLTTRLDILKRVINKDLQLIMQVRAERELVLQTKAALDNDRASILTLKKEAEENKKLIENKKKEKEKVLDAAVVERDREEQAYQELLASSQQIEQMLRRNQTLNRDRGPVGGSGSMMWPTDARDITSEFGWRIHPISGRQRYHSGLDIGVDYGDPVRAADGGQVVTSGWIQGYGYTIILDHGNDISTLYGHNSELVVSEGQYVRKGQIVARGGSSGDSTGPHVHFEVRQGGSPVSPWNYLP